MHRGSAVAPVGNSKARPHHPPAGRRQRRCRTVSPITTTRFPDFKRADQVTGRLRRRGLQRQLSRRPCRYGAVRPVPVIGGKSVAGPASTVIVAQGQSLVGARHGVLYLALQGGSSQPHAHHRGCLLRSSGQRLHLPRRRAHRPPSQTLRCSVTPPPSTRYTLPPKSFYERI
jgi:hypothetical protein